MKFYVSGKLGDESITKSVMAAIKEAGHEITLDWTALPSLKPYDKNLEESKSAAFAEVYAVKDADVFVIVPHNKGIGMWVELGVALGSGIPVYVITERLDAKYRSLFLYHPLVTQISCIEELLKA